MFGGSGYRIELTPRAWAQVGTLGRADFDRVRIALTELAATLAAEPFPAVEPRTLRAGELVLSCAVDPARRVLLLESLARDLAERVQR